jgi:threonyl-tRNA synthetase
MSISTTNETTRNKLATYLRRLAKTRRAGTVTADDAHAFLTRMGVRQQQVRTRLSYINSVLRTPEFEPVGETASARPAARGRYITEWSL